MGYSIFDDWLKQSSDWVKTTNEQVRNTNYGKLFNDKEQMNELNKIAGVLVANKAAEESERLMNWGISKEEALFNKVIESTEDKSLAESVELMLKQPIEILQKYIYNAIEGSERILHTPKEYNLYLYVCYVFNTMKSSVEKTKDNIPYKFDQQLQKFIPTKKLTFRDIIATFKQQLNIKNQELFNACLELGKKYYKEHLESIEESKQNDITNIDEEDTKELLISCSADELKDLFKMSNNDLMDSVLRYNDGENCKRILNWVRENVLNTEMSMEEYVEEYGWLNDKYQNIEIDLTDDTNKDTLLEEFFKDAKEKEEKEYKENKSKAGKKGGSKEKKNHTKAITIRCIPNGDIFEFNTYKECMNYLCCSKPTFTKFLNGTSKYNKIYEIID